MEKWTDTENWYFIPDINKEIHKKSIKDLLDAYKDPYNFDQIDLEDEADILINKVISEFEKENSLTRICFDITKNYPKEDPRSIPWEIISILQSARQYKLLPEDIPFLLEFLETEPGKELVAWEKWDEYWGKVDFSKERKSSS